MTPLEQTDERLSAAIRSVQSDPSAGNHRQLAAMYLSHGVKDAAFDQFSEALRLDRGDAVSYEGRARIWRDGGFLALALGDAYRALHYAPDSPSALNTLGTIFQLLGRFDDARRSYERVLERDPSAAYALNNLRQLETVK